MLFSKFSYHNQGFNLIENRHIQFKKNNNKQIHYLD